MKKDKTKNFGLPLTLEDMDNSSVVDDETGELKPADQLVENELFFIEVTFQKSIEGSAGFDFTEYFKVGVHPIEEGKLKEKLLNKLNDPGLDKHNIKIIKSQKIDELIARSRMDESQFFLL